MLPNARISGYIRRIQAVRFYSDTGNYIARTVTGHDTFGQPTYSESTTAIVCSFTEQASAELWRNFADIETTDCEIRFDAVTPAKGDRFTLTYRFGLAVTNQTFEIVGIRDRGTVGYVCALRAVSA